MGTPVAPAAESAKDFVPKRTICLKELRESYRWLRLIPMTSVHGVIERARSWQLEPKSARQLDCRRFVQALSGQWR